MTEAAATVIISGLSFIGSVLIAAVLGVLTVTHGGWWQILEVPGFIAFAGVAVVCWKVLWMEDLR